MGLVLCTVCKTKGKEEKKKKRNKGERVKMMKRGEIVCRVSSCIVCEVTGSGVGVRGQFGWVVVRQQTADDR